MEDKHNPDGWTFATLYQHVKEISAASKEAINAAMAAANVATTKAEAASEKRFDSVNEFREAMKDQQKTFADKEQTERRLNNLEILMAAKAGERQGFGISAGVLVQVIASVGVVSAIVSYLATRH